MATTEQDLRTVIPDDFSIDLHKQDVDLRANIGTLRDLNAIRDPMARLPSELCSDIFVRCLPDRPRPDCCSAPMLLLNICHLWNDIALATPFLWAAIEIDSYSSSSFVQQLLRRWVGRAGTLPLTFSIDGTVHRHVRSLVDPYVDRVQTLELHIIGERDLRWMPFSSLRKLKINAHYPTGLRFDGTSEYLDVLRAIPGLLELTFNNIQWEDGGASEPLTHVCLRQLHLGRPRGRIIGSNKIHLSSAYLLRCVTLPALESLRIANVDISEGEFVSFLNRSSPPLRSLQMVIRPFISVIKPLHSMAHLTDLELLCPFNGDDAFVAFFQALSFSPDFLPCLRNLTIHATLTNHLQYENLVRVLRHQRASRLVPLQSFRFFFPYDTPSPESDILMALREFVKEGTYIHIGFEGRNLISTSYVDHEK